MVHRACRSARSPDGACLEAGCAAAGEILEIDPAAATNPSRLAEWLMLAHPDAVGRSDIARQVAKLEARIASHHWVEGLVFPLVLQLTENQRAQSEPRVDAVADAALFNGIYLAGLTAKYASTGDPAVLREIGTAVDGMYKLTHITGVPGRLTRHALPLERAIQSGVIPAADDARARRATRSIYYGDRRSVRPAHAHLRAIVAGQNGVTPVRRSLAGRLLSGETHYGDQFISERTSRDQLTGVVFGLAFAMKCFESDRNVGSGTADAELTVAIRQTLSRTAVDIYRYLRAHGWRLRDPVTAWSGGGSRVTGLLRTTVDLLFRRALMNQSTDASWRDDAAPSLPEQLDWLRQDMTAASLPRRIAPSLLRMRATWPLTAPYYAWHLRLLRLISVLVLDDLHPACLANPPSGWRAHPLTPRATLGRNRAWLLALDRAYWRSKGDGSDPWATYLVNRIRAEVFRRHLISPADFRRTHPDLDLYSVSSAEFDRLAAVTSMHEPRALREALFASRPSIGGGLPRAHFHLRSLALKPWRSHTSAWARLARRDPARCQTHHPASVYPPHLMKFTTNFLFEKDPTVTPPDREDGVGWSERMLIDLPVLYWMIVEDGQWDSQWDTFSSAEFIPPGAAHSSSRRTARVPWWRARGPAWSRARASASSRVHHA